MLYLIDLEKEDTSCSHKLINPIFNCQSKEEIINKIVTRISNKMSDLKFW